MIFLKDVTSQVTAATVEKDLALKEEQNSQLKSYQAML